MPNSYTAVPAIIPGNLSVSGDLNVLGQVRAGASGPFARLGKRAGLNPAISFNYDLLAQTPDSSGQDAFVLNSDNADTRTKVMARPGNSLFMTEAPQTVLFSDFTQHVHTGTVTLDTIVSKVIRGNTLGANGGFRVRLNITPTAQGAAATVILVSFGGAGLFGISITAASQVFAELTIANRNATNVQACRGFQCIGSVFSVATQNNGAVDTTVDQTLALQIQNGTSTDSQNIDLFQALDFNTFGPV